MKDNILYFKRSFLRPGSLNGASILLYKDGDSIGGSFRLAWNDTVVTIHSLDLEPNSINEFIKKLEKLKSTISSFIFSLENKSYALYRDWLNAEESFATGSVAYASCEGSKITTCYFELASCTHKIRIYKNEFRSLKSYVRCLRTMENMTGALLIKL